MMMELTFLLIAIVIVANSIAFVIYRRTKNPASSTNQIAWMVSLFGGFFPPFNVLIGPICVPLGMMLWARGFRNPTISRIPAIMTAVNGFGSTFLLMMAFSQPYQP